MLLATLDPFMTFNAIAEAIVLTTEGCLHMCVVSGYHNSPSIL